MTLMMDQNQASSTGSFVAYSSPIAAMSLSAPQSTLQRVPPADARNGASVPWFDPYQFTYPEWESWLGERGVKTVHARTLWRTLYRDLRPLADPALFHSLPEHAARQLRQAWEQVDGHGRENEKEPWGPNLLTASTDGLTRKWAWRLPDGSVIESVLMGYEGHATRHTACLSTQVGCAMGCVFCATGQGGFTRHLSTGEIVGQVVRLQRTLREEGRPGLRNLVLMGMGEPLHNLDAVLRALDIVCDSRGLNLGPSRITISTVGVIPGIQRLAELRQPYNLAVSLHGATQQDRAALVPVAGKWPLDALMEACRAYTQKTRRHIFFEWTLIAGKNDDVAHARALASLLKDCPAHVNIIPLNPTAAFAGQPAESHAVHRFQQELRQAGIPSTVRQRRGIDVDAGCGQLAGRAL
jgi:23S rRNA (adenine2503-C2)-methyltransferase